jgi:hypothetical protein
MSNDLATTDDDGFGVDEPNNSFIVGGMIKFNNDHAYIVDKTQELTAGTRLVALSVTTAWTHWQEGKPEHHVTQPGQAHPCREDLPDQDKSLWEDGLDGNPADPWRDSRYLRLIDPRTGKNYTFVTDTKGGRAAIGELKSQITNVRRAHPGAVPVVELRWKMWKTKVGLRPRPVIEVVDWRGGGSNEEAPRAIEPDKKRGAIEHHKEEFEDEIPF